MSDLKDNNQNTPSSSKNSQAIWVMMIFVVMIIAIIVFEVVTKK